MFLKKSFWCKMRQKIFASIIFFACSLLFAYNPPPGGQNVLRLPSPIVLQNASSAAGGPIFTVTPLSILENPALPAYEQRAILDFGGGAMIGSNDVGGAFHAGILAPTRLFIYTAAVEGVFSPFYQMPLKNSFSFAGSASKDVSEKISIGLGLKTGVFFGAGTDWILNADLGVLYKVGDLGFLKDFRLGVSVLNLGKVFTNTNLFGIKGGKADFWPAIATLKIGIAASLVQTKNFTLAASIDVSAPAFQDFIFDAGLQASVNCGKIVTLFASAAFELDALEVHYGAKNLLPSASLSARFMINAGESDFMREKGWEKSDITIALAWKNLYKDINSFGAEALINLGTVDTDPPKIVLWDEEQ